jgi:AraC-like DNA-binding protein
MSRGRARLAISEGFAAWVLEAPDGFGDAGFHTHHAIQLTISLSGDLALTCGEQTLAAPIIAVATHTRHKFAARGLVGFIFVEPESPWGRALSAQLFGAGPLAAIEDEGFATHVAALGRTLEDGLPSEEMLRIARAAVAGLAAATPAEATDPRVLKVIDQATARPELSLDEAAAGAGVFLSPSRLRHLFVEQTGLAFKTFMQWRRLFRALEAYAQGRSLTEAAHGAGFADSAHFSRVFRRFFGLPATTLTRI